MIVSKAWGFVVLIMTHDCANRKQKLFPSESLKLHRLDNDRRKNWAGRHEANAIEEESGEANMT